MPKTCANCGSMAGRGRALLLPGEWVEYLESERGLSSQVGRLTMPLCADCYLEVNRLRERPDDAPDAVEERNEILDEIDLDALVDEGT